MDAIEWIPVGDQAILVKMGNEINEEINACVMRLQAAIEERKQTFILETVPSFTSLLVYYDSLLVEEERVLDFLQKIYLSLGDKEFGESRTVSIPVCYDESLGEDLPFVAEHAGISTEEVIRRHSGRDYRVYMLGFLPGFPYLGGMDPILETPRLAVPRTKIPAGSVGIGGAQTGIYPMESPGGWQLIGRTPFHLFSPGQKAIYHAGDLIRFCPISKETYEKLEGIQSLEEQQALWLELAGKEGV